MKGQERSRWWGVLSALVLLAALGCSSSRSGWTNVYPVKGLVTYKNQPVEGATVTFYPVDSGKGEKVPGAYGRTNAEGRYSLTTFNDGDGAAAGEFVVMVAKDVDEGPPGEGKIDDPPREAKFKSYLPAFLKAANRSPLRVTIPPSGAHFYEITLADEPGGCSIKSK